MINLTKPFLSVLTITLLTACSFHSGSISSTPVPDNVTYEDIAIGVSQAGKLFGIGGVSQDALVFEAKRQLYYQRPLGRNESYANFTIDFKKTVVLFYSRTKVTVTADVIQQHDFPVDSVYSVRYQGKIQQGVLINAFFNVGDSVVDKSASKGVIVSVEDSEKVRITVQNKAGKLKSKVVSIYDIYKNNTTYNELKIGDKIRTTEDSGTIVYLGLKALLYLDEESGNIYSADYTEIKKKK